MRVRQGWVLTSDTQRATHLCRNVLPDWDENESCQYISPQCNCPVRPLNTGSYLRELIMIHRHDLEPRARVRVSEIHGPSGRAQQAATGGCAQLPVGHAASGTAAVLHYDLSALAIGRTDVANAHPGSQAGSVHVAFDPCEPLQGRVWLGSAGTDARVKEAGSSAFTPPAARLSTRCLNVHSGPSGRGERGQQASMGL